MANTNAPYGFVPIRMASGNKNIPIEQFTIADNYSTKIHTGTVIKMTGTGRNIVPAAAGDTTNAGVFCGCRYEDINGKIVHSNYYPGDANATNIIALVYADPTIVFRAQCDTLAAGDVGALADLIVGTGNDMYGRSSSYTEASSTATSGKSLRILGLYETPGNVYGAYAQAEVMFAEHIRLAVAGV